jgi:hypothetical protein
VASTLKLLSFDDAAKFLRVKVRKAVSDIYRFSAFNTSGDAVNTSARIDCHEVTPITSRESPSLLLEPRLKLFAGFGVAPDPGHEFFGILYRNSDTGGLQHFDVAGRPLWPFLSFAFSVSALNALVSELPFKVTRDLFVLSVIVTIADRGHAVDVDA